MLSLIGEAKLQLATDGSFDCSDQSKISTAIPHYYKLRIAEAVLAFSELEHAMASTIGHYLKLVGNEVLIYTDVPFSRKIELVRDLTSEKYDRSLFDKATNEIFPALSNVANIRNLLVHGSVFMWERRYLVASSYRPRKQADVTAGTLLSAGTFTGVIVQIDHLRTTFFGLAQLYSHPEHQPLKPVTDRSKEGLLEHRDGKRQHRSRECL